jgi:hypothetical protein
MGRGAGGVTVPERAAVAAVGRDLPAALALVLVERLRRRGRDEAALVGEDHEAEHQVVLKPPADRQVVEALDLGRGQVGGRPDAREHQQLRRVVRAGAQDHLALGPDRLDLAAVDDLDTDRAGALEDDPPHPGLSADLDVAALDGWPQVGDRRRPLRCVTWKRPAPSCVAPATSSLRGMPTCSQASTKASTTGCIERLSLAVSGPPTPW